MDGADNIFSHIISETDVTQLEVGMRLQAEFKPVEQMQGHMSDIRHFNIVRGAQ